MTCRWMERSVDYPAAVAHVRSELNNLPEALARALVLRGIDTFEKARRYFRPSVDQLHDPFLMKDMDRASDRVAAAITSGEKVLVYGDYDVDGTTATALVTTFLRMRGVEADYFVPHRIEHGYGLSKAGIDAAESAGATLIIALDCGITAFEEAQYTRSLGIDLIICDHHTVHDTLPDAVAVLDPKRPDCDYPFSELSGCGIGFKLVAAVLERLGESSRIADQFLDLVAVSIASDIVPIQGENRVLMRNGLERLRESPRTGLKALARRAGLNIESCTTSQIVFTLGPRINAAGRLGDAGRAVDLLLSSDDDEAAGLADVLEHTNDRRRTIDRETVEDAARRAEELFDEGAVNGIVLHDPSWHPGVVGIVASRLVERFVRPTILLTTINGIAKGSARSVDGVNIFEAIQSCGHLVEEFGGHDYAAGLSIRTENIPAFAREFDRIIREVAPDEAFVRTIRYDAGLDLKTIDGRFWSVLRQFAPYGPANSDPVFRADALRLVGKPRTVGRDDRHLKFVVGQNGGRPMEVIGFGLGDKLGLVESSRREGRPVDMLYSIQERIWNGRRSLQLKARDVRASSN